MAFSNIMLIPVTSSPNDLWSTVNILERIKDAQQAKNDIKAYFLINRYDPRTTLYKEIGEALEKLKFPEMETRLGSRIAYPESAGQGRSVLEGTDIKAKDEILSLTEEIREIMGEVENKVVNEYGFPIKM